jgi:hypothetical protein
LSGVHSEPVTLAILLPFLILQIVLSETPAVNEAIVGTTKWPIFFSSSQFFTTLLFIH